MTLGSQKMFYLFDCAAFSFAEPVSTSAENALERSPPKWIPVRRKRAHQNKSLEPFPIAA
ncbi:hypothetical protein [Methylobacterium dankookense]|uniref:hypothetical protein n=1 Tax=Methylobacterium dankookense TaxID=560405 RepID=UPI0011A0D0BF|nr:hypothetical protein [Methylobacterium dankookense]